MISLSRRMRAKQAPRAKGPRVPTGGTEAPPQKGPGYASGLAGRTAAGQNMYAHGKTVPAPPSPKPPVPNAGAGAGGASGGTPAVAQAGPPPETSQRFRERQEEGGSYSSTLNKIHADLYNAALRYGDPSIIALYGNPANPDTGQLQETQRKQVAAQKQNVLTHNADNTFFSGRNLVDMSNIDNEAARARERALTEFREAQQDLLRAELDAREAHKHAGEGFDEGRQREFEETEPEPQETPGGAPGKTPKKKAPPKKGGGGKKGGGSGGRGSGGTTAPKKNPNPFVAQNQAVSLRKKKR